MVKIIQTVSYPDSFDVENIDESQSRQYIGKLGGIRRKNLSEQDKYWVMEQLLAFMKSPFSGCKTASSKHMSLYFVDVKDLQEQAADALYDLCEDVAQEVRICGYSLLQELVGRDHSWTERNTYVLLQLLQTENAFELEQIRKSIAQCVKHDPPKALDVICDHVVVPSQPSESYNPELRDLVMEYLSSNEMIDASLELFKTPESTLAFGNALAKILQTSNPQELGSLVRNLINPGISSHPKSSFVSLTIRGIIEKAKKTILEESSRKPPGSITLDYVQSAADLASKSNVDSSLSIEVIELAGTMLSATWDSSAVSTKSRIGIAKTAIELCRINSNGGSKILAKFDKFTDALLASDSPESWVYLKTLLVDIADRVWPQSRGNKSFETSLRAIKRAAESRPNDPNAVLVLKSCKSYIPTINRPAPTSQQTLSVQVPTAPSLKRKAELSVRPADPPTSTPNPTTLLSRLNPQTSVSNNDRSAKRLKAEPTLLDRLQVPSTSSSPSPSPSIKPPSISVSDDDRGPGPGKSTPTAPSNRGNRINQRSSPYTLSSELRIKNASSASTSTILEPMKNTTLDESNSNRGLSVRGRAKQVGTSSISANADATTIAPAATIARSLSIKGAASKSSPSSSTLPPKPTLLERTSLASATPQTESPKQQAQPVKKQLSIQERLGAPSLVSRLSSSMIATDNSNGDGNGGGRRRKGKNNNQH